jgi:ribosomal protein S18 acetylase RimI-like enzyme
MSSAELRRMDEEEWDSWFAQALASYAEDLVVLGGMDPADAEAKARQDQDDLVPQGMATPGHHFFHLVSGDERVGSLWLAEEDGETGPLVWVYDLWVEPGARGHGFGRQAMLLAEQEARRLGQERIGLHVFSDNETARGLYASLGYEVTKAYGRSEQMVKSLNAP